MTPFSLAETWHLNNRANLMLLESLSPDKLNHTPFPRARSISDQFAHLHNVRIMWLEIQMPEAARSLPKIAKGTATKASLREALEASADAFAKMLAAAEKTGKLRSAKRGIYPFFAYAIAHEAHHRGQIIVHLKHAKVPVDRALGFALWEWEKL
jgi:uncharacterized damage-inducible protein DinB